MVLYILQRQPCRSSGSVSSVPGEPWWVSMAACCKAGGRPGYVAGILKQCWTSEESLGPVTLDKAGKLGGGALTVCAGGLLVFGSWSQSIGEGRGQGEMGRGESRRGGRAEEERNGGEKEKGGGGRETHSRRYLRLLCSGPGNSQISAAFLIPSSSAPFPSSQ